MLFCIQGYAPLPDATWSSVPIGSEILSLKFVCTMFFSPLPIYLIMYSTHIHDFCNWEARCLALRTVQTRMVG